MMAERQWLDAAGTPWSLQLREIDRQIRWLREHGERMNPPGFAEFSGNAPLKRDLLNTGKTNVAPVGTGEAISLHPETYAVAFVVLAGEGVITVGDATLRAMPFDLIAARRGETRGISAGRRMMLPGIHGD